MVIIKISIVSSNRTKYLSMRYVSAKRLVVELARVHGVVKRIRTGDYARMIS